MDLLIESIIRLESGGDSLIINYKEQAVGLLQIRKIYVDEVNRLSPIKYEYVDRFSKQKSIEMFKIMMNHYCPSYNVDTVCMVHNAGGISNRRYNITTNYRNKIKKIMYEIKRQT